MFLVHFECFIAISHIDLAPDFSSTSSSPYVILLDCYLYLLLWGEASNFRHMPEMMCFIFHVVRRVVNPASHVSEQDGPDVLYFHSLHDALRSRFETMKESKRRDQVAYDDMNESDLIFSPFVM